MLGDYSYAVILLANVLWFSAAPRFFSFQQRTAAKLLTPKSTRELPLFETIAAFSRFLGGMNGAFALLSFLLLGTWLWGGSLFEHQTERGIVLIGFAAAHFSQFIFNVPILRNGERQAEAYWYVKRGPMLIIFIMDAALALLNFAVALLLLLHDY